MTTQAFAEKSRSKWPARGWATAIFVLAAAAAWVLLFGIWPIFGWEWAIEERLSYPALVAGRAVGELTVSWGASPWQPKFPVLYTLSVEHALFQYFGRLALIGTAAAVAAHSLYQWRYRKTPRTLVGTRPHDEPRPWSEGVDAVAAANAAMARSVRRTGRGLEIAPGVGLSKELEALSIALVGDPGSGKTVALWSLIFQLRRRKSLLIVHDVKGDMTARWPDEGFILFAPHDPRSCGWAVGRDIVDEHLARELAAQLIPKGANAPHWPLGAQEILVGVQKTLQFEQPTAWGFAELKFALDLPDAQLREFASRHHPAAARFLALGENGEFTLNASSYVSTLMAPISRLVSPLADAWGDLAPDHLVSLREWADRPDNDRPVLMLQRAPDRPEMSTAWIGAVVKFMTDHLLASRRDHNPTDRATTPRPPDVWFLLDEFPQIGLDPRNFLPILEVGRSLGLRCVIGLQNFGQLSRFESTDFGDQLMQLVGTLLVFGLTPGPAAAKICDSRLTKAQVQVWENETVDGKTERTPHTKTVPILTQADLAELDITRDGVAGYMIRNNAAYRLTWPFSKNPVQRDGRYRP